MDKTMKCCANSIIVEETIQKTVVNHCLTCGLIQKKTFLSLEEEKKRYDFHVCDDGYKKYMEGILNQIKYDIKPGRILDFGCGQIHLLSDLLCEKGQDCVYYDFFYYPIFPKGLFDTIVLVEVFEHLKDPLQELQKMEKMLTSHGKIIIVTQPYDGENLEKWWYFRDTTHVSFIHSKTIQFWNLPFQILHKNRNIFILERIY